MRIKLLFSIFFLLAAGCTQNQKSGEEIVESGVVNSEIPETTKQSKPGKFWEPLAWNQYRDNNGMVILSMPFPSSWKVAKSPAKGEPSITGPNGIKIIDFPGQSYMLTNDPWMQQSYSQSGQQLRAMPGVDQLIQQDFIPWGVARGLQYVKHYEIPEVAKIDKWYSDQLYKAVPTQSFASAIGSEWKDANGNPFFLLIHLNVSNTAELQTWYYFATSLEAENAHFDKAKKQLVFALSNARYELEPIMAYNRSEAEKAGKSWAAHNQRVAQNQANFEAQQRNHVNKSNAINDAIMSGWKQRNASSDRQQEKTIDGIYERTNVIDPGTGQQYKVAAGATQYWMNNNGEYISTDLQDYNPNLDDNMNEQRWQELKEVQ